MATWVLLRGLVRESRHWEGFPDALRAARPLDNVVTVDLPGNGSLHHKKSPTRIGGFVLALREELNRQGLQPPFQVLALSLGAMTAISWMSTFPEEVERAVLLNTSVSRFSKFFERLRPENYRAIVRGLFTSDRLKRERIILEITVNNLAASDREVIAQRWAGFAASAGVSRMNSVRQLWAAARFKAPASLPDGLPVLVLNGGRDRLVSPACSQALATGWGLPLRRESGAGHDLTLDAGGWVIEQINDWLTP